jgi:hypothetical protein
LQVLVHGNAIFLACNPCRLQVEVVDLRHAPGGMHHQVSLDHRLLLTGSCMDKKAVVLPLDARHRRQQVNLDAEFPGRLHQLSNQVGVKFCEGPAASVEDLDVCASPRRDVGELEGDVAPTDEDDAARKFFQFQKLRAGRQLILTWYPQGSVSSTGRDHHVSANEGVLAHLDARPIHEVHTTMPCGDPGLGEALLVLLWHRVGESAFEADQVRPIDGQPWRGDTLALHAPAPVHELGNADQDLLGVAPT